MLPPATAGSLGFDLQWDCGWTHDTLDYLAVDPIHRKHCHNLLTLRGAPQRHRDPAFNARLAFSPDGARLAASNWDESISLWEAAGAGEERQAARLAAAAERAPLWHLQEAEQCVRVRNKQAAEFHLRRLGDAPLTAPLEQRRKNVRQAVLGLKAP